MNISRSFDVATPLGTLHVWAKHEDDTPDDFPGVYVDLITKTGETIMLACVEYESVDKWIQTCVYGRAVDDSPTHVEIHDVDLGEGEL